MKAKLAIVAIVVIVMVALAGCAADEFQLELSDSVIYTGVLRTVVYSNNQLQGYQLTFEDGKTIFVSRYISTHALYNEGFDLGKSYTISQTKIGDPYVQRTDVLEKRRAAAAEK